MLLKEQKPIIVNDIEKETRFADMVEYARTYGVRSVCLLPLTSPWQRLGILVFGTTHSGHAGVGRSRSEPLRQERTGLPSLC
jgi:GAF domain-containing protein